MAAALMMDVLLSSGETIAIRPSSQFSETKSRDSKSRLFLFTKFCHSEKRSDEESAVCQRQGESKISRFAQNDNGEGAVSLITVSVKLRSVFRSQRSHHRSVVLCRRIHDFHFGPIVRQFLAAIQAHHIRASNRGSCIAAQILLANSHRKTVMAVPAAEKGVE